MLKEKILKNNIIKGASPETLWVKFINGDNSAIDDIYREVYQDLYCYGQRFDIDKTIVEDSIQMVFLNFFKYRKSLKEVSNVRSYIFRSFRNIIIKKTPDQYNFVLIENVDKVEEEETRFDEKIILEVKKQINNLSSREKEIILLKYYENYKNGEIAEMLGIEYNTVRNLIARALGKLRKIDKKGVDIFLMLLYTDCYHFS